MYLCICTRVYLCIYKHYIVVDVSIAACMYVFVCAYGHIKAEVNSMHIPMYMYVYVSVAWEAWT